MLVARALCGFLGSLCAVPIELLQIAWETGQRPRVSVVAELVMGCGGGAMSFATRSASGATLPWPWSWAATVAALTPFAVVGQHLRLRMRLGCRRLPASFVALVAAREAVLQGLLLGAEPTRHALVAPLAHAAAYPIKLLALATCVPVRVAPRAVACELLRVSMACWCSARLAALC